MTTLEIDKPINKFNYEQLDKGTSEFLKEKEKNMRDIATNAATQIGKELKEAQEKLAGSNQYNGVFEKWYTSLGFKKDKVYRMIQRYNLLIANCEDQILLEELPLSLTYEIAKPSADPGLKQQVFDGDITTLKQYKELEKEKKQLEEAITEEEKLKKLLATNFGRLKNNPVKQGKVYQEYEKLCGVKKGNNQFSVGQNVRTQEDIAKELGVDVRTIRRLKQFQQLSPELQDLIEEGTVKYTTALNVWSKLSESIPT